LSGIQRDSFIPCIELIKSSLEVINLSSENDYRTKIRSNTKSLESNPNRFIYPINEETDRNLDYLFEKFCPNPGQVELSAMGRTIKVNQGILGKCAKFSFAELFEESKSAADYIEICRSFSKIFIKNIFEFKVENRNEIRRFITFIDQVYEAKVQQMKIFDY
jgi:peroxisome-assembly ATPase